MKIYKVGGCIRDKLLGLPVSDNDYVVVGSSPKEMISLGYVPVGKEFPVFLHPETKEEYALARTETKTGEGYKGFSFRFGPDITLEEDLKRRDLTINAIAEDMETGMLIDPYGGIKDIENKVLRHTSEAFSEDPLRVLRVLRFKARFNDFRIHSTTVDLMEMMIRNGELDHLTPERVWIETEKALRTDNPHLYFELIMFFRRKTKKKHQLNNGLNSKFMFDLGDILFPELIKLIGKTEPEKHHPEKYTWEHTLLTLKAACKLSKDPVVRFAALVHDIGKGETPASELPHHYGHEKAGLPIIEGICDRFKVSNEYRELALLSCRYHMRVRQIWLMKAKTTVKTLMKLDAFRRPERFKKFLLVCEADYKGRLGKENKECDETEFFNLCFDKCKNIDIKPALDQKLSGIKINEYIYKCRKHEVNVLRRKRK